MKDISEKIW